MRTYLIPVQLVQIVEVKAPDIETAIEIGLCEVECADGTSPVLCNASLKELNSNLTMEDECTIEDILDQSTVHISMSEID